MVRFVVVAVVVMVALVSCAVGVSVSVVPAVSGGDSSTVNPEEKK